MGDNWIKICGQRVSTHVGVPQEERAVAQEIEFHVAMRPSTAFSDLNDALEKTVDYFAVSERIKEIAATGERLLIETLASEVADRLLGEFAISEIRVELRKFILENTDYVAVIVEKSAEEI